MKYFSKLDDEWQTNDNYIIGHVIMHNSRFGRGQLNYMVVDNYIERFELWLYLQVCVVTINKCLNHING